MTLFAPFRTLLSRWLRSSRKSGELELTSPLRAVPETLNTEQVSGENQRERYPVPETESDAACWVTYDENLLERARTQWQFGDWHSLAQLNRNTLQHHPDRAKLALLAAAGRLQTDKIDEARQYIRLAIDWGVSKKLLTRILAAGVHNSLGRAAAIVGEQPRALQHFHSALATGTPGSEARLLVQAHVSYQHQQLGLPPVAIGSLTNAVPQTPTFLKGEATDVA